MKKCVLVVAILVLNMMITFAQQQRFLHLHPISVPEQNGHQNKGSRSISDVYILLFIMDNQLQLIFEPFYKGQAVYNITDEYGNCFANGSIDSEITNVEYIDIDILAADYYVITLMVEDGSTYEGYIQLE